MDEYILKPIDKWAEAVKGWWVFHMFYLNTPNKDRSSLVAFMQRCVCVLVLFRPLLLLHDRSMKLSSDSITDLQRVLHKQFGAVVSIEDAEEIGIGLVELYQLILKLRT